MERFQNLLNIAILSKSFFREALLGRLLSKAIGLIIFIVICSGMMCSLLIFALYVGYLQLLQSGMDAHSALYLISSVILILMILLSAMTFISLRSLQNLLKLNIKPKSDIGKIIEAFKEGLQNK